MSVEEDAGEGRRDPDLGRHSERSRGRPDPEAGRQASDSEWQKAADRRAAGEPGQSGTGPERWAADADLRRGAADRAAERAADRVADRVAAQGPAERANRAVTPSPHPTPLTTHEIAARIARDIPANAYVNLGIGLPTLVAEYLAPDSGVVLHTENGMLNMGPAARGADVDPDLTNAGKAPVTELPGASYFHHADSFAMMRGGHLDICVLGGYQVSASGDLANWHTGEPGAIPAVGGAMDLAIGARRVFVMMTLFTKAGEPKLVPRCTYPLTGLGCVDRVYTDHAILDITPEGVLVRETFGLTVHDLANLLEVPLR